MARKRDMTKDERKNRENGMSGPGPEEDLAVEETADTGMDDSSPGEAPVEDDVSSAADTEEEGAESEADTDDVAETEVDTVQDELDRLRDQHLRLAADFENHRKRASADLAGVWARAQADLVRSLVQGLDDLQRVSQFTSDDTTVDALIEGVDLVERNLLKALTDAGLEVLNPEGEHFDPNSMEAMMRVPTEEDGQDDTVHQVFLKGYMFKDQLVRPARVSVYKDDD